MPLVLKSNLRHTMAMLMRIGGHLLRGKINTF